MNGRQRIDLNCDAGEGFPSDEELFSLVSSANIACGGHAGDEASMERSVDLALRSGVAVGAHPGFLDRQGFGRRQLAVEPQLLEEQIARQLSELNAVITARGASLSHVKAHGALYSLACSDPAFGRLLVHAVRRASECRCIYALSGSSLVGIARAEGFRVAEEGFADRAYSPDGCLAPRGSPGALIADPIEAAARGLRIASEGRVVALDGTLLVVAADTICIHGDEPGAVATARALRHALAGAGIVVRRFGAP